MFKLPRLVGFGKDGKAVGAGFCYNVDQAPIKKIMNLPSRHYDFIDINVYGKTKQEILAETA
jgi:hypothetical protein